AMGQFLSHRKCHVINSFPYGTGTGYRYGLLTMIRLCDQLVPVTSRSLSAAGDFASKHQSSDSLKRKCFLLAVPRKLGLTEIPIKIYDTLGVLAPGAQGQNDHPQNHDG